jgi:protease-4
MTREQVDSIGRGRVWSGSDALEIGLIDRIGGVLDAVDCAAGLAGMDSGEVPDLVVYPQPGFFDGFSISPFGGASVCSIDDLLRQVSTMNRPMYLMQPLLVD